ncbi:hypothetical protein ACFL6C_02790 [Myxococcota bacterium]
MRSGRPQAAAAVWRSGDKTAKSRPRLRGLIQALIGALATALFAWLDKTTLACIVGGIAGFVFLSALLSPHGLLAVMNGVVARLAHGIGMMVTWLVMVPVFTLFFTPFGLLLRRGQRDPLKRQMAAQTTTYWRQRSDPGSEPHRLERPF